MFPNSFPNLSDTTDGSLRNSLVLRPFKNDDKFVTANVNHLTQSSTNKTASNIRLIVEYI